MEKCNTCGLIGDATANCGAGLLCPVPVSGAVPITDKDVIVQCAACGIHRAVSGARLIRGQGLENVSCKRDLGSCEITVTNGSAHIDDGQSQVEVLKALRGKKA